MLTLFETSKNVINLPRYVKRIIAIILDLGLCIICTWFAFYLRLEQFIIINEITILPIIISITLAIPIFWLLGLYRTMLRFAGSSIVLTAALATLSYGLIYFVVIGIYGIQGTPRSIGIIQPLLLFFGISTSKLSSLENNLEMKVVGFLDDNKQFHNQTILGQTVFDPLKIIELNNLKNIDLVLLALPSINRIKRNQIIEDLNNHKIIVKTLPSIQDIVDGKISVSDIKDLTIEDLLDRDEVTPNLELLTKNINSKVVLVTGAGGSIGSELCRQIIRLRPKKLLLLELNEFALYQINEELIQA